MSALQELSVRVARYYHPAGLIYGLVVAGSVIAVTASHDATWVRVAATTLITSAVYWLAHVYCEALGDRLRLHTPIRWQGLRTELKHESAILTGAAIPLVVLVGVGLFGGDLRTAAFAALWTSFGALLALGYAGGRASGARGLELAGDVAASGLLGALVLLLKTILH